MEPKSIIIVVLVLMLLYVIVRTITYPSGLTSKTDAKTLQTVSSDDLESSNTSSVNFAYSIWFYVDDWNYKYNRHLQHLTRINLLTYLLLSVCLNISDYLINT